MAVRRSFCALWNGGGEGGRVEKIGFCRFDEFYLLSNKVKI